MSSSIIDKLTQEVTSFALAPFKEAGVRNIRIYTFQMAMTTGNLEMIKTVKELFNIIPEEIRPFAVFECCSRPSKELVQWWVKTCEPSRADLLKLFQRICWCGGMADTARELATQFAFTKDDLLSLNLINCNDSNVREWLLDTYYKDNATNLFTYYKDIATNLFTYYKDIATNLIENLLQYLNLFPRDVKCTMTTPNIDGKQLVNAVYHGAVVAGLTIGTAKLIHMVFKKAALPKLDADVYDAGMLVLDASIALAIRDVLVKQGILPPDIMK